MATGRVRARQQPAFRRHLELWNPLDNGRQMLGAGRAPGLWQELSFRNSPRSAILLMGKLRHNGVKPLVQGHRSKKWELGVDS